MNVIALKTPRCRCELR